MNETVAPACIDVRAVPPPERHSLVFSTFRALAAEASMELISDHDPRPLFFEMQAEQPGRFSWDYLQSGPEVWRVQITKTGGHGSKGQCCGGCGGS